LRGAHRMASDLQALVISVLARPKFEMAAHARLLVNHVEER